MAQPSNVSLDTTASLVVNYISEPSVYYKIVQIPASDSGRVIYFKEQATSPGPPVFAVSSASIQNSTMLFLQSNASVTLQAFSTNTYSILGSYSNPGAWAYSAPTGTAVNLDPSKTMAFVDVTTQAKTVVLPPIQNLVTSGNVSPTYIIKDAYGMATTNPLHISTSGGDTFGKDGTDGCIRLAYDFGAVEFGVNLAERKWLILNWHYGYYTT